MNQFLSQVQSELERACAKHPPLHSLHEAYAVILEEVDEVKTEVWKQTKARDLPALRLELVQIAAMCARTVQDCLDKGIVDETITKKAVITFPDSTRLEVMRELIQENQLPVWDIEHFYSEQDGQPALSFLFDGAVKWVLSFLTHAQTINLASSYYVHSL